MESGDCLWVSQGLGDVWRCLDGVWGVSGSVLWCLLVPGGILGGLAVV